MHNGSLNLVFEYCATDLEKVINDTTMLTYAHPNPDPNPNANPKPNPIPNPDRNPYPNPNPNQVINDKKIILDAARIKACMLGTLTLTLTCSDPNPVPNPNPNMLEP